MAPANPTHSLSRRGRSMLGCNMSPQQWKKVDNVNMAAISTPYPPINHIHCIIHQSTAKGAISTTISTQYLLLIRLCLKFTPYVQYPPHYPPSRVWCNQIHPNIHLSCKVLHYPPRYPPSRNIGYFIHPHIHHLSAFSTAISTITNNYQKIHAIMDTSRAFFHRHIHFNTIPCSRFSLSSSTS